MFLGVPGKYKVVSIWIDRLQGKFTEEYHMKSIAKASKSET